MKIKSILLSSLLALGCTAASAQEEEEAKTVNVFNPHGFVLLTSVYLVVLVPTSLGTITKQQVQRLLWARHTPPRPFQLQSQ